MKNLCKKCGKRDDCLKLCEKAEKYVNQDYVEREESLAVFNIENREEDISDEINLDNSNVLKLTIILLHLDGKSQRGIAELVPCSRRYIRQIIKEYENEISNSKKNY